jgi:hypothetical protein
MSKCTENLIDVKIEGGGAISGIKYDSFILIHHQSKSTGSMKCHQLAISWLTHKNLIFALLSSVGPYIISLMLSEMFQIVMKYGKNS